MREMSKITGEWYEAGEMNFYRNIRQSIFFIEHGAKLVDLFVDSRHMLVFVFTKKDHERINIDWMCNKRDMVDYG